MCGIAGIIDYYGRENSRGNIEAMLQSISYRGPDESGIYLSAQAAIGNVRLSIIDIEGGQQPLSDPTGRFWIVFNGEIFNYKSFGLIWKRREIHSIQNLILKFWFSCTQFTAVSV